MTLCRLDAGAHSDAESPRTCLLPPHLPRLRPGPQALVEFEGALDLSCDIQPATLPIVSLQSCQARNLTPHNLLVSVRNLERVQPWFD